MNYLKKSERLLKHSLKNKRRITLSLIVAFLITGGIGFTDEEAEARDLRSRSAKHNQITSASDGPSIGQAANGTDVININKANGNGISHNKFIDFNVGKNGVIFNNNATEQGVQTKLAGIVDKNTTLGGKAANAILSEVTGNNASNINGVIEVAGTKADFILANENGITVNGGGFINTSGVTLTTGKPTINGGDISLGVNKGKITIEQGGVGTSGDYFNLIAKTIELKGQVAAMKEQTDPDINLIAGQNKVSLKDKRKPTVTEVVGHDKTGEKYGIYASELGAMYGRNIRLISTTEGLGVRHEGIVRAAGDFEIDSNGDIVVGGINSDKGIKIKGKGNFDTVSGTYDIDKKKYSFTITANDGVEIDVTGDISIGNEIISQGVKSKKGTIKITGNSLKLLGNKGQNGSITSNGYLVINVKGDINFQELLKPVRKPHNPNSPPLIVQADKNGNIKVIDPLNGQEMSEGSFEWESGGVYAQDIDIKGANFTNDTKLGTLGNYRDNKLDITLTGDLTNNNSIVSSGNLDIKAKKLTNNKTGNKVGLIAGAKVEITANELDNKGQLRQNTHSQGETTSINDSVKINIKDGTFTNSGIVSGYNVEVTGENFKLVNTKDGVFASGDNQYPFGLGNITINAKTIENSGTIRAGGSASQNNITITAETLKNIGYILSTKGNIEITTSTSLTNSGEIIAEKDKNQGGSVTIKGGSGSIKNEAGGKIGGENITIKSTGEMTNAGIIAGVEKVLIEVNKFINAGSADDLKQYLESFYKISQESQKDAEKMLEDAKKALASASEKDKPGLQAKVNELEKIVKDLKGLNEKLAKLSVGMISAKNVDIKTTAELENKGIIKADNDVKLNSGTTLKNDGVLEAGKKLELEAKEEITNSNRMYAGENISIKGKSFTSTGTSEKLTQYLKDKQAYDEALKNAGVTSFEDLDKQIKEKEEKLKTSKDKAEIDKLTKEINDLRTKKQNLATLRAKVLAAGVGNIESKNVKIETTEKIDNQGIILTNEKLELKAGGDIKNGGTISVGTDANIEGNNFVSDMMTVGNNLIAKVKEAFESKSLTVGKNMNLEAKNAKFTQDLGVGGNLDIKLNQPGAGNVIFGNDQRVEGNAQEGTDINVTGNVTIAGGGLENKLNTAIGGNLNIDKKENNNAKFDNSGHLSVKNDTTIKIGSFNNSGEMITGGSLDVNSTGKFTNTGKLQAIIKEQARNEKTVKIKSQGFENSGDIIFGGKTTIDSGDGEFKNTKTGEKGSIEVNGDLDITTTSKLTNSGKLQSSGKLNINSGDLENQNDGLILSNGMDITATGDINNVGSIQSKGNMNINGNKNLTNSGEILVEGAGKIIVNETITNSGKLQAGKAQAQPTNGEEELKAGDLVIETGKFTNKGSGTTSAENDLKIKVTKGFSNEKDGNILGGSIYIDGTTVSDENRFDNAGNILASGNASQESGYLKIDLGKNEQDITIESSGKLASNNIMTLITGGNIKNGGRLQNPGGLDFKAGKGITNTGMLVSLGDIKLTAKNDIINGKENGDGATIWSNKDVHITSEDSGITNNTGSTIEAKQNMSLTAENGTIANKAGTIKAGGKIDIKAKKFENKSIVDPGRVVIKQGSEESKFSGTANQHKDTFTRVEVIFPDIDFSNAIVKSATVLSGGNMTITTTEGSHNLSGKIGANGDLTINGNMKNETVAAQVSVEEILKHTIVKATWITKGQVGKPNSSKEVLIFQGNLVDNKDTIISKQDVLEALKNAGQKSINPKAQSFLEVLDAAFNGKIQTSQNITAQDWTPNVQKTYYLANASASIIAKGNINIVGGEIQNIGAKHEQNKEVSIELGPDKQVDGVTGSLGITVQNPNDITEINGIKYPEGVEVIKGEVTINGVTISGNGSTVGSIAVAGTINPIGYIDIPQGQNGVFKPATPKPNGHLQYKYETNIEFIDPDRYYGSKYFFDKIGYDPDKTPTVVGDAYYEKTLIEKMIRETLGFTGEITEDNMKTLLDQATEAQKELGLEVGKPLTPEQINNLEKDIIWYVEVEMDGEKVLVPQIYFGKETRLAIAEGATPGGAGSNIKAGGNIDIEGGSLTNSNSNISAGGNINVKVDEDIKNNASGGFNGGITAGGDVKLDAGGNIDMKGGTVEAGGDASLAAGGDINIESGIGMNGDGNQTVSNEAGVKAGGNINVESGGDTNITNGKLESTEGNVNISGENVNIKDQNLVSGGTSSSQSKDGLTTSNSKYIASTSDGSEISGKNVNITSKNDTNITGSFVGAENSTNINAGGNVNIEDGQNHYYEETNSKTNGIDSNHKLNIGSSTSKTSATTSAGSTVGGLGDVNIKAAGDVTVKGSDVIGGENGVNIEAGKDVNIIDGQNTVKKESSSEHYDVISYSKQNSKSNTTTSVGSGITTAGDINIKAGGNVKSVGSDLSSLGDTNIEAKGDVKFEAGKNTHEETSNSFGIGVTSGGVSAGAAGVSAESKFDIHNGATSEIVHGKASDQTINDMNKVGKSGKNYMDSITKAEMEIGISIKNSSKKSTTWTEGNVQTGGDLNIKSGGTTDIGGADFTTGGDFNITAKEIDSTKYTDEHEEKNNSFNLGVKVSNDTTSSIADAVNKGMQIDETVKDTTKDVNGALVGAQVAGTVTNVIFGDLLGNTTKVTGELGYNNSSSKTTEENITNIKSGGNINFKSTEGDINLKGVDMNGKDVTLDSAGNVNIESAKKTEVENSYGFNVSGGVTSSAGVATIDGANAQLGVTGSASVSVNNKNNTIGTGSSITGDNITIKSAGDTNVKGSNVEGNDVKLDIGGDLNIETEKDSIDQTRTEGWLGGDLSAGVASNTIVTGDAGGSAGGGQIFQKGDKISNQAGITAKNKIDANVGGDLNLKGGVIGSETGEGSLDVKGNINVDDIHSNYEEGGAIVGANGGTKGGGILGEVGDVIDQEKTAKGTIGLGKGNVTVGGDVTVNGNKNTGDDKLEGVNTDLDGSLTIDKDVAQGGGTFSGTASKLPGKKSSNGKFDVPDGPTPPPPVQKVPDVDVPKPVPGIKDPTPESPKVPVVKDPVPPPVQKVPDVDVPKPVPGIKDPTPESPKVPVVKDPVPPPVQKVPDVDVPQKVPSIPEPTPENPKIDIPEPPKVEKVPVPPVNKEESVELPKPEKAEPIPPKDPVPPKVDKDPEPPKPPVVNGYIKDPVTGKWVPAYKPGFGAALTGGGLTSDGLKGYKKGVESLIKGETKVENPNNKPVKKAPQYEGKYIKDENGNWHKVTQVPGEGNGDINLKKENP